VEPVEVEPVSVEPVGERMTAVDEYLEALPAHDWDKLAATLAPEGLVRDGPFVDVIHGKQAYVDFLKGLMPTLKDYVLRVSRQSSAGHLTFVELSETFDVNGTVIEYPEVVLFEVDGAGLITFVSVFMKYPGMDAPVPGASAS
jgi:limonene-1,2-epoxide hydrolase